MLTDMIHQVEEEVEELSSLEKDTKDNNFSMKRAVCPHFERQLNPNRNPKLDCVITEPLWLRNKLDSAMSQGKNEKSRLRYMDQFIDNKMHAIQMSKAWK